MNKYKLTTQINIIFSFITILSCVVFVFVLNTSFQKGLENLNIGNLKAYYDRVVNKYADDMDSFEFEYESRYNDYVVIEDGILISHSSNFLSLNQRNAFVSMIINRYYNQVLSGPEMIIGYTRYEYAAYQGIIKDDGENPRTAIFAISNTAQFVSDTTGNIPFYAVLGFINILALGNIIIWMWSSSFARQLKEIQSAVDSFGKEEYQKPLKLDGVPEIIELAHSIDYMRETIKQNEQTKKEIIQNLGHDLKTPIAVIKSYAEAISDGIETEDAAKIIAKQTDILEDRVAQIIEYNKIEYLEITERLSDHSFKEIIKQVINHYKYMSQVEFIFNVHSDWIHPVIQQNLYIAISNIIDNNMRYARTKIVITLENKKLTIYNDGEHIDEALLPKIFKPYEKGAKGQTGLGLSIVKTTLAKFGLKIDAQNKPVGVCFTIEPQ